MSDMPRRRLGDLGTEYEAELADAFSGMEASWTHCSVQARGPPTVIVWQGKNPITGENPWHGLGVSPEGSILVGTVDCVMHPAFRRKVQALLDLRGNG